MSYANVRSPNADLNEGITDGRYKKVVRDRGGVVEALTHVVREDLADVWYGIHEEPNKMLSTSQSPVRTPNFVATRPVSVD